MINLIVFGLMVAVFCGAVFWLAHNTNEYNRRQRKLIERRRLETISGDELLNLKPSETIVLSRRETRQILDLIENPPPPTEKFLEAQARYQAHNQDGSDSSVPWSPNDKAKAWIEQNREAIESSNEYVEKNGLPLEKVRNF